MIGCNSLFSRFGNTIDIIRVLRNSIFSNFGDMISRASSTVRGGTEIILDVKNAPKNVSCSWNIVSSENESLIN